MNEMRNLYYKHLESIVDFGHGPHKVAGEKTVAGLKWGGDLFDQKKFEVVFEAWNARRLFVWSDMHFFHQNISKYTGRPFESVYQMNNTMAERAKDIMHDDSVVLFGGDISFGSLEQTKELLSQIPGKHFLILGNHDVQKKDKRDELISLFDGVSDCLELSSKNRRFWISHYPFLKSDLVSDVVNIHGHTHQHRIDGPFVNMCVEHTNYSPILLHELILNQQPHIQLL